MRVILKSTFFLGMILAAGAPASADSAGERVEEYWESAQMDGAQVGFVRGTVRRLDGVDGKRFRASEEMDLTFKRNRAVLRLRRERGTEETSEGKVVGVFMKQGQEGGKQLILSGALEEGRMHVRIDDGRIDRRLPWSDEVVGMYGLEHLFAKRKPKANDRWTLKRYDPTYNAVTTVNVAMKEREKIALTPGAPRIELWRVEMTPQPLEAPGITVRPPAETWWLNDHFDPVRRQIELEGLGTLVLTRTTRQSATTLSPARSLDIGLKSLLPLNRALTRPYATRSVDYRITLRGDADPSSALTRDAHQTIDEIRGESFTLHVHPPREPERRVDAPAPSKEYLASCRFIDSEDERVKELARRAAGGEMDAWAKAKRIERWVKQNMRVDQTVEMGPASEVARRLRGDCRQYALLTSALCRAEGIPSRTAIGLIYVEKGRRPTMGFHMWTEVCIEGQWLGLDATLGLGGVSAAHIKISDHSWHDTPSLTPLLPVSRVLGKMKIDIVNE